MGKFIVQEPLRHNGEDFEIGSQVELDGKVAKDLLASGIVVSVADAKAKAEAEAAAKAEAEAAAKGQG